MEKIYRFATILNRVLQRFELMIGGLFLTLLLGLMLFNAIARYLFDYPVIWSDEMNNFLFIWMAYLSCAFIMGNDGHIRVTAFTNILPHTAKFYVSVATNSIMLVAFVSTIPSLIQLLDKVTFSGLMRIPLKYVYFILPLAFGLMCIHIVINMICGTHDFILQRKERTQLPKGV